VKVEIKRPRWATGNKKKIRTNFWKEPGAGGNLVCPARKSVAWEKRGTTSRGSEMKMRRSKVGEKVMRRVWRGG